MNLGKYVRIQHAGRLVWAFILAILAVPALGQTGSIEMLPDLTTGRAGMQNALWIENSLSKQFKTSRKVVVAQINGPAEITMMHFALPQSKNLERDLLLKIFWDGEKKPSVDCPLVDFFCDPDGLQGNVNSALVVVRRGFNCYFPMPFRKSARVELVYDGAVKPGPELWRMMPCYSYVCYRTLTNVPANTGYFCASWKQETLRLGLKDYVALEAKGKGKFVGWNVTVRQPGRYHPPGDENEKFYVDGETTPSIEFQGLEDSFGFSWGFPKTENMSLWMGYFPFMKGDAGYRFFVPDPISFEKSLKVTIGFGKHDNPGWRQNYSKTRNSLQFSSTVYWYQTEPHAPLPPMPPAVDREPDPEKLFWPAKIEVPSPAELKARGVKLAVFCGFPQKELIYSEPGYSVSWTNDSREWSGWDGQVFYCRQSPKELRFQLNLPKGSKGRLRLFIIDPDNYQGGRKETIMVGSDTVGTFDHFTDGRWVDFPVGPEKTAEAEVNVRITDARDGSDVVLSKIEWVGNK